jgi:hypothetical protein
MMKFSTLAIVVMIVAGISAPAMAQIVVPSGRPSYGPPPFYAPAPPLIDAPAPLLFSLYSNHPAATGGGSYGYNVKVLRHN